MLGIEFINESIKSAWIIIEIYHNQDNKNVKKGLLNIIESITKDLWEADAIINKHHNIHFRRDWSFIIKLCIRQDFYDFQSSYIKDKDGSIEHFLIKNINKNKKEVA